MFHGVWWAVVFLRDWGGVFHGVWVVGCSSWFWMVECSRGVWWAVVFLWGWVVPWCVSHRMRSLVLDDVSLSLGCSHSVWYVVVGCSFWFWMVLLRSWTVPIVCDMQSLVLDGISQRLGCSHSVWWAVVFLRGWGGLFHGVWVVGCGSWFWMVCLSSLLASQE